MHKGKSPSNAILLGTWKTSKLNMKLAEESKYHTRNTWDEKETAIEIINESLMILQD